MALKDLVQQARELSNELPRAAEQMDRFNHSADRVVDSAVTLNRLGKEAIGIQTDLNRVAALDPIRNRPEPQTISGGAGGGGGGNTLVNLATRVITRLGFGPRAAAAPRASAPAPASPIAPRVPSGPQEVEVKKPTPGERLIVSELRNLRRSVDSSRPAPTSPSQTRSVDYKAQGVI
jgi:hypothetical protein